MWSHTASLVDEVDTLVRQGAEINAADALGDTALHTAAACGHKDIVARLLQCGADVNVKSASGKSPSFKGMRPLHAVVEKAPEEVFSSLLDLKCDANETDDLGQTALHLAARAGRTQLVLALLAHGATVCPRDRRGRTPLHWATSEGHSSCSKALLEKGADVHARTEAGTTALHWVACLGCVDTATLLLDAGADVNARNNDGFTPLDRATSEKMKDLLTSRGGKGSLGWWSLRN